MLAALPQRLRARLAAIMARIASPVHGLLLPRRLLSRRRVRHTKAVADGRRPDRLVDVSRPVRHATAEAGLLRRVHSGLGGHRDVDLHDAGSGLDVRQASLQGDEVQIVFVSAYQRAQRCALAFL